MRILQSVESGTSRVFVLLKQTIALFRYQLLGIVNSKIILLLIAILMAGFLLNRFVAELAIINSDTIGLGVMAEFLRYSLLLLLIVSLCHQISQDYELNQFDRLLAMPLSRGQYVLAQFLVLLAMAILLVLPMFILLLVLSDLSVAVYWSLAVLLELLLVGQLAVLAILSLEKLPVAVIFTLAIYLLARTVPFVDLIFDQSTEFYQEETGFQFAQFFFAGLQYVFPDMTAFAQNNAIFTASGFTSQLGQQLISVVVYGLFIQFIILVDFYRKEFNRS